MLCRWRIDGTVTSKHYEETSDLNNHDLICVCDLLWLTVIINLVLDPSICIC